MAGRQAGRQAGYQATLAGGQAIRQDWHAGRSLGKIGRRAGYQARLAGRQVKARPADVQAIRQA